MNRRQKIIVSITGIFLVLLILVGLTYAYFLTKIQGNSNSKSKSISVTTANLVLEYGDGNGVLSTTGMILPGDDIEFLDKNGNTVNSKMFTVTNTGSGDTDYTVMIEDVVVSYASNSVIVNEIGETINVSEGQETSFVFPTDFVYTLTCKSYKTADYNLNGG